MGKALKLPKTKCCVSKSRCDRCPIRMLKDGDLPSGYGVHRRELVRLDERGRPVTKKSLTKKKLKAELAAVLKTQKNAQKNSQKKKAGKKKKSLAA